MNGTKWMFPEVSLPLGFTRSKEKLAPAAPLDSVTATSISPPTDAGAALAIVETVSPRLLRTTRSDRVHLL